MFFLLVGEHTKIGTGRSGEGAGLLLQQAARGGAAVPGTGRGERRFRRPVNGGSLRLRRPGESETSSSSSQSTRAGCRAALSCSDRDAGVIFLGGKVMRKLLCGGDTDKKRLFVCVWSHVGPRSPEPR